MAQEIGTKIGRCIQNKLYHNTNAIASELFLRLLGVRSLTRSLAETCSLYTMLSSLDIYGFMHLTPFLHLSLATLCPCAVMNSIS